MFKYKNVKTLKNYKEKEKKNLSGIHKYQKSTEHTSRQIKLKQKYITII